MAAPQNRSDEPSNAEVLAKMSQVLEMLATRPSEASTQAKEINDTISTTLTKLSEQFALQNARQVMPSNAQNLDGRSYFRPKGHLHPDYEGLKWHRQPWHNGHRVTLDEVSPDEIAVFNELSQLLPTSESRRTARGGKWIAWVGKNNADLYLKVPCKSLEDQAELPVTLVFLLREFIDGKAIDPASLFAELTQLKADFERVMAANAAATVPA